MVIDLHRQAQMVEGPPGHAKVSEGNKPTAKVQKSARRLTGKPSQARAVQPALRIRRPGQRA